MTLVLDQLSIIRPDGQPLFAPLNLAVDPGAVATVMGPSGIGKSTLLDAIGGHLATAFRQQGRVLLDGRDLGPLPPERRRIGILFQEAALFPHLSVADNLAFGLTPAVRGRANRRRTVDEALERAGLSGLGDRDPATLSGGQRGRAALMQTLLSRPSALLLDEPFSRLDMHLRDQMRRFVFSTIRDGGIPALLVTHDPEDASAAGGAIVDLTKGVGPCQTDW